MEKLDYLEKCAVISALWEAVGQAELAIQDYELHYGNTSHGKEAIESKISDIDALKKAIRLIKFMQE